MAERETRMARIEFDIPSRASPETVRAALLDFSPRRPELWPGLPPDQYEVYEVGDTWAEIREGYRGRSGCASATTGPCPG